MKNFITRNTIKQQADYIISVPYDTLETIYSYSPNKVYYNSGAYGWNYDCIFHNYLGYNFAIISGYRPFMKTNISYEYTTELNNTFKDTIEGIKNFDIIYKISNSVLDCMCSYFLATKGIIFGKRCTE